MIGNSKELYKKAQRQEAREHLEIIKKQFPIIDDLKRNAQRLVKNKLPFSECITPAKEESLLRWIERYSDDLKKYEKNCEKVLQDY